MADDNSIQTQLDEQDAARRAELLKFAVANQPGIDLAKIDEVLCALRVSGVEVEADGRIPLLSVALKSLAFRQPSLFKNRVPGVVANSREQLAELFVGPNASKLANALALHDLEAYREAKRQAKSLGIIP